MSSSSEPSSAEPGRSGSLVCLAGFLEALPQCGCILDDRGTCLAVNRAFSRWLSKTPDQLVGRDLTDLWPTAFAAREASDLRLVLSGGRVEQLETRPGPGGDRSVRAVKIPWTETPGGPGRVVVLFEECWTPGWAEGSEGLGWLALGIAHEFTSTLGLLRDQLDLLADALPDARDLLAEMARLLEQARGLPRRLLTLPRSEGSRLERVDLATLLSSLEGLLRSRSIDVVLETRLDPHGAWVLGDATGLARTLLNLATCALGTRTDRGRLVISLTRAETVARVAFECPNPKKLDGGSPVDLSSICLDVQRLGGRIASSRQTGRLVLELPLAHGHPGPAFAEELSVLVVEPETDVARLALLILEQAGYRASTCQTIAQGRNRAVGFDLLIVEASVLGREGARELERWLEEEPRTRLLLTSTGRMPLLGRLARKRLDEGDVVSKPYSAAGLLDAVRGKGDPNRRR